MWDKTVHGSPNPIPLNKDKWVDCRGIKWYIITRPLYLIINAFTRYSYEIENTVQ